MKKIALLLISLFVISCSDKSKTSKPVLKPSSTSKKIDSIFNLKKITDLAKYSNSEFKLKEKDTFTLYPYEILYGEINNCETKQYEGSGLIIINNSNNKLIWEYFDPSDFPPHTFSFIDFDNDNDKDLYMYSGFEDVFVTSLFINQIESEKKPKFKEIYNNHLSYCSIVDIDNDGFPEIINTISQFENEDVYLFFEIDKKTESIINKEYDRIVGKFDKYNEDYNMPKAYKNFAINLLSETNILKVVNGQISDVTNEFHQHKEFRRNTLDSLKNITIELKPWIEKLKSKYK
ncbi:hypothetical protein [Flavicella sediminum]|uniref:hypothetical protein n=1 Tax=Flavicella sediminum TaxID=2585141 RepID=UPI00111FE083|nr:hypothetical protein [Flavicella sediminum]